MLKQISEAYSAGDLDCLKASILPFLKSHINELRDFIHNFHSDQEPLPLECLIKYFILSLNKPFDMKQFLKSQGETMVQEIGPDVDSSRRRELMCQWIQDRAEGYRSYSMMQQVYCFEQVKEGVIPEIQKLLEQET